MLKPSTAAQGLCAALERVLALMRLTFLNFRHHDAFSPTAVTLTIVPFLHHLPVLFAGDRLMMLAMGKFVCLTNN
jgi:hypothetical protein